MSDDRRAALAAMDVSRETAGRLDAYAALLARWTQRINLVAPGTLGALWSRHFLDSAQLLGLAPPGTGTWADLGSGGGFPGAVVAILAGEKRPELAVTLVEADQRKAAFLRALGRETGTDFKVLTGRIEDLPPLGAHIVSARALAPLPVLLGYAARHLAPGGTALIPKGAQAAGEVAEARKKWSFSYTTCPSQTDPEAAILKIGEIARV